MPFVKKFELMLYVPETRQVSGDMPERWAEALSNNAGRIYDRLMEKVPDDGAYQKMMVEPSDNEYADVLNPARRSKRGHTAQESRANKHKNMAEAYPYWYQRITGAFANGATAFKQAVANAKSWWASRVEKVLRITGDRVRGRGLAPIAAFWLVGDKRAQGWITEGDYSDGAPYDVARDGEIPALKAAIAQRLVQGGTLVINADNEPDIILAQNDINTSLLNGLRDTAKCDLFSATYDAAKPFCLWRLNEDGRLYLHVQVGLTV